MATSPLTQQQCPVCGAPASGLRCRYCGTMLRVTSGFSAPAIPAQPGPAPTWYPPRTTSYSRPLRPTGGFLGIRILVFIIIAVGIMLRNFASTPSFNSGSYYSGSGGYSSTGGYSTGGGYTTPFATPVSGGNGP